MSSEKRGSEPSPCAAWPITKAPLPRPKISVYHHHTPLLPPPSLLLLRPFRSYRPYYYTLIFSVPVVCAMAPGTRGTASKSTRASPTKPSKRARLEDSEDETSVGVSWFLVD